MDATGLQHRSNSFRASIYLVLLVFISNILHGGHVVSSAVFLSKRGHLSTLSSSSTVYSQTQSLQELYVATNGANWQWKNSTVYGSIWNFSSPVVDPCGDHWQGVNCTCSSMCSIVGLQLRAYNLVGSLPSSIGNISTLEYLDLSNNKLTSTIPKTLSRATDLFALSLAYNRLTGTLPQELTTLHRLSELYLTGNELRGNLSILSQMPSMKSLFLRSNIFSGPLFDNWSELTQLTLIDLAHNRLEGPFPSNTSAWLSNSPNLMFFDVGGNHLTGTVVDLLASAKQLVHFNVSRNYLHGSLPCSLQWKPTLLYYSAGDNYFAGSIPSCVLNLTQLEFFNVANNQLHSRLPAFQRLPELMVLSLTNNQFYGDLADVLAPSLVDLWVDSNRIESTIPDDIAERCPNLTTILFQNNQLLGTLPAQFNQLSHMNLALLYNNNFSGPIDSLYDPTVQPHMTHIDISGNRFNGPLPPTLFDSASLVSFVASTNCFSGTLPAAICNATQLQALLLDGLSTSSACLTEIFPHSPYFHTFKVKPNNLEGKIPECIFDLPKLQTLHLAGNTFSGTLPTTAHLSSTLVNLSLAHNTLVQSIPTVFQARSWLFYDVSYNRFRGYLSTEIPTPARNASFYADVNRLSGSIPKSLVPTLDISILAGNNFACRTLRTDLPENDPKRSTYDCGSDPVYRSMYLWVLIMAGALCLYCALVLATRWYDTGATPSDIHRTLAKVDYWLSQMDLPAGMDTGGITSARNLFRTIKGLFVTITLFSIVVLMPINAGLTVQYATQDQSYVWVTSSVFLSGWVPAFALVIGFSLVLLMVWRFLSLRREEVERTMLESERNTAFYVSYTLLNVIVMGTADVAYVVGISKYGGVQAFSIILGISIFKLGWNEGYLLSMFLTMKSYFYFYLCNDTYNIKRRLQEDERLRQQQHLAGPSLPPGSSRRLPSTSYHNSHNNGQRSDARSTSAVASLSLSSSLSSERIPPRERFRVSELLVAGDGSADEERPPQPSRLGRESEAAYRISNDADDASVDLEAIRPVTVRRPLSTPAKTTVKKRIQSITTAMSPFHGPAETHSTVSVSDNDNDHDGDESDAAIDLLHRPTSLRVARLRPGQAAGDEDDDGVRSSSGRSSGFADSLATMYTVKDDLLDDPQSRRRKQRSYNLKTDVILNSHDIAVITFNLIVNTVLLPGISVMFASPNCFYHIFYPSQTTPGSYAFSYCASYDAHGWYQQFLSLSRETLPSSCPNAIKGSNTVAYVAPFTYNYTCASNIITVYSEAFLYQTLAISLIAPTSKHVFKWINSYLRTRGDTFCCFGGRYDAALTYKEWFCCCYWACFAAVKSMVQQMVPRNLWTLHKEPPHDDFVFFDQTFIPRIYSLFSILLVYGVIFPPLAAAVCTAALVITYSEELIISRLISKAKASKLTWVILRLSEECQGVEHRFTHPTLIWLMMLTVCPVYTYLVFDTAADPYGWRIGLIPAVFMFVVPTLLYIVRKSRRWGICTTLAAVVRRRPVTQQRGNDTVVVSAMHATLGASGASQTPCSSTATGGMAVHATTTGATEMDGAEGGATDASSTTWQRLVHDPLQFAQEVLETAAVGIGGGGGAGGGHGAQKSSVRGLEMLDLRPDIGDRRHLDAMLACEASAAGKEATGEGCDGSSGSSACGFNDHFEPDCDGGSGSGGGDDRGGSHPCSLMQRQRTRCESADDGGTRDSAISLRGSSMFVGRPSEIRESVSNPVSLTAASTLLLSTVGGGTGGGVNNGHNTAVTGNNNNNNRISGAHAVVSGFVGGTNATPALTEAALAALTTGTVTTNHHSVSMSDDARRNVSVDNTSQLTKRLNSVKATGLAPLTRDRSSDLK